MALRQSYETQSEIPPVLAEFYAEKDGKWWISLDPPAEDVTGLKTALNTERGLRRDAEKVLTDLKTKFEGVDVDEYRKLQERVKGLDDADVYDKQGIEALVSRRTESMKAEHERQTRALERENAQLKDTVATTDKRWRGDRIRTALLDAVSRGGVFEKAIDDAVQNGCSVFTDLDEHGNVVAGPAGAPIYGKDGVNPLTPGEWILTVKASGEKPHWWLPSSGGGAPAHHGGGTNGIDYSKLPPAERMTLFREQQAAQNR